MKNIESDALLEYSADQLYEVIDDCSSYDLANCSYVSLAYAGSTALILIWIE